MSRQDVKRKEQVALAAQHLIDATLRAAGDFGTGKTTETEMHNAMGVAIGNHIIEIEKIYKSRILT